MTKIRYEVLLFVTVMGVYGQQVHLSLGPTNITTNNTEVFITDIGEGYLLPSLVCHTDLTTCCRNRDNNFLGSLGGEWYYPDGRMVIPSILFSTAPGEDFYRLRNTPQVVELIRVTNTTTQTGTFCCVIPTTEGVATFCANIVLCPSLPPLTNGEISYSDPPQGLGSIAIHSCDTGYAHKGGSTRTCQSDGTWNGAAPICKIDLPVYLSLSSTKYLFGLSKIPLSSVGEGRGSSLVCHTDLSTCCRQEDSGVMGGLGEWHYPNNSVVSTDSGRDGLYVSREQMSVSLNYRSGAAGTVTAGLYCCVVPTSQGNQSSCIILSVRLSPTVGSHPNTPPTPHQYTGSQQNTLHTVPGTAVGGVVAVVFILVLGVVATTYLVLKHKKQQKMSVSRHESRGQSSIPTRETTNLCTYEEISSSTQEVKGYDYSHNKAYVTTTTAEIEKKNEEPGEGIYDNYS